MRLLVEDNSMADWLEEILEDWSKSIDMVNRYTYQSAQSTISSDVYKKYFCFKGCCHNYSTGWIHRHNDIDMSNSSFKAQVTNYSPSQDKTGRNCSILLTLYVKRRHFSLESTLCWLDLLVWPLGDQYYPSVLECLSCKYRRTLLV